MRHGIWVALAAVLLATPAAAQDDEGDDDKGTDKDKDDDADAPQGSLDSGGDPADREGVERGPYSPTGGTGKVKVAAEDAEDADRAEVKRAQRKKLQLFLEALIGWGAGPVQGLGNDDTTSDATGFVVTAGGSYDFSPRFTLGLRVPWTTAEFDTRFLQPNTAGISSQAFGNPELKAEYRVSLSPRTDLPIGLGIGIPIAQGNPDIGSNDTAGQQQLAVNLFADAVTGWRDGELFMPKRLPIVPSVGLVYEGEKLDLRGYTKLVLAPNLGQEISEQPPNAGGTYEISSVAVRSVTGGGAAYWFLDKPRLSGGLDAWAVINAAEPLEFTSATGATGPSRFQFVIEPRVAAMFGPVKPSVGYVLPLGGRLSDSGAQGVRIRLDVGF